MSCKINIRWTKEAQEWLDDIYNYISKDSKAVASRVISEIYSKVQVLKVFPNSGYLYRSGKDEEIRILLFGHYRIAYIVKDKFVDILGVFHGALKIEKYVEKP